MPLSIQDNPELVHGSQHGNGRDDLDAIKQAIVSVDNEDRSAAAVSDTSPEALDEMSDSDSQLEHGIKARGAKDARRLKEEAEGKFTRKDGIIYLAEDNYINTAKYISNCHIIIALPAVELAIRKEEARGGDISMHGMRQPGTSQLPPRIRIVNELLLRELNSLCGVVCDHDHAAPFRTLILYEQELRQSHRLREFEFEEISRSRPLHPAVLRKELYLPKQYTFRDTIYHSIDDDKFDHVERSRFLLDGLRVLMRVFDTELGDLTATVRKLKAAPLDNLTPAPRLPFFYLWYLFNPGEEIVCLKPWPQVYRVLQVTGGRKSLSPRKSTNDSSRRTVSSLSVDCMFWDFNGKEFGARPQVFHIRPYDDLISVTELSVFPLKFADQKVKDELVERGHKFVELADPGHRRYQGLSLKEGDKFDVYEEIDSDVIIDFQLAFQNGEAKISPPLFGEGVISHPTVEDEAETHADGWSYDDPELLRSRWSKFSHNTHLLRNRLPGYLTKDIYILLPYRIYGYVLLSRKWLPLHIDLTTKVPEIKPGENDSFQKLVLPEGHKDIVRALVSAHARQRTTLINGHKTNKIKRDIDIVKGKGKGLIILLHGAPGVGKTSTAECVAANARRPLLPITCGDLGGISAKEVEQNLENFFDLARKWNCVLLLDEADVFLSARDGGDIRQTSLVSVFLRVLEYYSGILILTTNRVGSFDEAIKSRVHCALYYPPLDQKQSIKIWKMNLATLEERNKGQDPAMRIRFNRKEIEAFARKHWKSNGEGTRWNGRQIKNAFQTAIALADWDHVESTGGILHPDGPLLKIEHFKKVAQASAHFDNYLISVRNTDGYRAKQLDIRRDDIGYELGDDSTRGASSKAKSSKSKSESLRRPKSPSSESSDGSSEEETEDEEDSDASLSQSESGEKEEKPVTPPPKKKRTKEKGERQ